MSVYSNNRPNTPSKCQNVCEINPADALNNAFIHQIDSFESAPPFSVTRYGLTGFFAPNGAGTK